MDLSRIFVAVDYQDFKQMKKMVNLLGDKVVNYKIGHPLFTSSGTDCIKFLKDKGKKIFLDLKFFDIQSVIYKAVENLVELEIDYFTVHALAGSKLLSGIAEITVNSKTVPLGVTILTSFPEDQLKEILLIEKTFKKTMEILIKRVINTGVKGIVCSPKEIKSVRNLSKDLLIFTPGIRMMHEEKGDQHRIMTPQEAVMVGADYLVMGRTIIQAQHPLKVLEILEQI